MKKPALYVVATPIGNKSDISLRALDVLKEVDIIATEDSRVSKKLLESYGITTKLVSYHKFNEKQRTEEFLKLLKSGQKIALISDAGTPCISDPGRILVKEIFENNIEVTSIPGPSAITTFLSQIPRSSEEFAFIGFLPRIKSQQEEFFKKFINTDMVFYEAANRLTETLNSIKDYRGTETKIAIGRELTKMYEETVVDTVENILKHYESHTLKGEVVGMVYAQDVSSADDFEIAEKIKKLKTLKYSDKDISTILSSLYGYNKNQVYKLALSIN